MQFVKEGLIEHHGIVINTLASYFGSFTIKTAARKAVILIKILYVYLSLKLHLCFSTANFFA
jgi:hypothetical protein